MSANDTPQMDGRRRTWIKADVFFYSGDIGKGLRSEFGMEGMVCFDAFLRACKVSGVEGQIRYASDEQFLAIVGLDSIAWTNDQGVSWTLSDLWRWLGKRHMTATRRQNGLTTVVSRRWDDWQTRRSRPKNARPMRPGCDVDAEPEKEKESEKENPPTPRTETPDAKTERLLEEVWKLYAVKVVARRKDINDDRAFRDSVIVKARTERRDQVLGWVARFDVTADQLAAALLDGVPSSWNHYSRPKLKVVSA